MNRKERENVVNESIRNAESDLIHSETREMEEYQGPEKVSR